MTEAALREAATLAVTVNGAPRAVAPDTTLDGLLHALALDPRMVVVEHNRTILRDRSAFAQLFLAEGDSLEIVHFVGGG